MLRLFLFISILLSSLIITVDVSASVTYTPGAIIAMTGSNSEVRFDVAAPLMGYDATVPALVTGTRTFTGAFYGSGIGWINFSTGSYQVLLNCGVQSLGSLTSNCTLTGTGWSENVGDIYFSSGTTVTYDRTTGLLSGSVITFAGDLSLTGIILPIKPVELNETSMIAHHNATLTVSGAWMYEGSSSAWNGNKAIGLGSQSITGINGIYTLVDFSLAGTYTITIEDPNSSKTAISGFIVSPGVLSTTLDGSSFYAKTFCTANYATEPSKCPDGATRGITSLMQIPPTGPVVANESDSYQFRPKIRDTYGNRVTAGSMKIVYNTSVSNIQTNDNINYTTPVCPDAISVIGGGGFSDACGTWEKSNSITDVQYMIWSAAPTNTTNTIQLSSIVYTSGSTVISLPFSTAPLTFTPLYTASISAPAPTIGVPHTFIATVVKNDATTTITPTIINTLKVGGGNLAEWADLSSTPTETCVNYQGWPGATLCNWNSIWDEKASIATPSSANFIFTGTYELIGGFPPIAPTDINTYIYYNNGTSDILYSVPSTTISQAITPTLRLRIFGQSEKWMNLGPQNRVDLINSIRKNIALLSRNRTDYTTADHIISTGNKTITNADFSPGNKRSIIVVGGDISITQNIPKYTHPIAIIALTDANGNGGNITISGSVTDIHSTLIAEHAILSETSNKQLYINGSVISSNPPQDIPSTTCPYFVTGPCISTNYDLPEFRSTYDSTAPNASIGGSMYFAPLIIEIDPRLITDAPPAINK